MNGGVNGTMEEPMELSHPASPKTKQIPTDENALDSHSENSNSNEANNHIENDKGTLFENSTNCQANEDSNASNKVCDQEIPNTETKVPSEEHSNDIPEKNHCSNSNESNAGSLDSSQIKSEDNRESEKFVSPFVNIKEASELSEETNKEESNHEIDCDVDSSEGEGSEMSADRRAEDAVSINSDTHNVNTDDEPSQESKAKNSDMVIIENEHAQKNQNGNNRDSPSPEVHEIVSDNDDCVVENNVKAPVTEKMQLRRSSRAIKRKRYDDDLENGDEESDIEVVTEDPLRRKSRPIVINDTKTLVQMAARQMKASQMGHQKKEPTVVIIDTKSGGLSKPIPIKNSISSSSALNAQNLYQSIVARGTSVTPISSKTNSSTHSSSSMNPQPMILPSLTDDMFVVEAPSFIVPYVYEKPSIKPFREFVDELGSELEEQKAKEEKERTDKDKEDKEKEREDREGESEEDTEKQDKKEELPEDKEEDEKKKKKAEKRDDDASWDGESSTESDDEIGSDEEDKTIVIKDKADSIEEIKDVTGLTVEKVVTGKSDNYFDCSLGKFFMNIGLNLVQEFVQTDLLKQQNRKLYREKKSGQNTRATETSIASLMKNLEFSKENNAPYRFKQKKCEFCSFKSESVLVMAHHLETPHMKNNVYKCNYCTFEIRSPHDILYHMEAEHNVRGKLERAPAYHQCANCPFEDNGKGKLARHLIPCAKKFKPEANLAPPVEWEPPAKIPKITKSRNNNMMGTYQSAFHRGQVGNNLGRPPLAATVTGPTVGGSAAFRARGRSPISVPPRSTSVHGTPMLRGGVMIRHNAPAPVLMPTNYPTANNGKNMGKSMHQPSISITPLPRQPQPVQPQPSHQNKSSFVICEICDGYIKDLEQLRNHMQWIHKVKIHPKMIYNRPPLNCQKCQFRFFTDQGLERHLLGCHGLVTSSMQEAANKGKDAGRCPVCGRVYQWKLLNHVARDHNLTLKPAHLSYKCTVCTATFGMYKQFENHVYSAHSVVAKRVMDKGKVAPNKANDSLLKPLKINDEITIIPQPAKPAAPGKDK
ncbi:unnamed protein product [Parnassius mnemosyne]|uniref:MOG interacting and ectopic P-granules protein 1 n=1 Tax=Parnassius mnemosyne TaxID=213953 RepID=A0AAV1L1F4_9NEOP